MSTVFGFSFCFCVAELLPRALSQGFQGSGLRFSVEGFVLKAHEIKLRSTGIMVDTALGVVTRLTILAIWRSMISISVASY